MVLLRLVKGMTCTYTVLLVWSLSNVISIPTCYGRERERERERLILSRNVNVETFLCVNYLRERERERVYTYTVHVVHCNMSRCYMHLHDLKGG